MPNVRNIGSQSATRDATSGGRFSTAFRPSSVSCKPRRNNHPRIEKMMLARKGTRQPQAKTCCGVNRELISQAAPEPRMNPMVVPAAVELLMRPRIRDEEDSVV